VNKQLAEENARLKSSPKYGNEIININNLVTNLHGDSSSYKYTTALVINNSINKPYNYITLNKGTRHGIKPDQGIISVNGIVGVTFKVSDSFTLAMSVLNNRWSISAKIKKNNYFGSLVWQGGDYRTASLREIPIHVNISKGDTVVTSGFSSIFPEGIMIGIIENFSRKEGDNYYTIDLSLAADFKSLAYVEVIENFNSYEILKLEEITEND
jgi:rod shape-determining protein MreC